MPDEPRNYKIPIMAVTILFLLFQAAWSFFITPRFGSLSGGAPLLDLRFWYDCGEARELLERYGPGGRDFYRVIQAVDFVYPLVYGAFFFFAFALLVPGRKGLRVLFWLLAGAATFFDYLENIGIALLLRSYPAPSCAAASLANLAGSIKFTAISVSFAAVALLIILRLNENRKR